MLNHPMVVDGSKKGQASTTAVLCSGGLDSAVLLAHETRRGEVQPVFIASGLAWEAVERDVLGRLLGTSTFSTGVRPLVELSSPVRDVYPATHWALEGTPPAYDTPDRDVYLVGRNILLLSKVATFCAIHGIGRVALGPLAGNPFPDATLEFFTAMEAVLSAGLAHQLKILAPFATLHKKDVIELGVSLGVPLEFTLSCMKPLNRKHCGRCSKCRERLQAFEAVGLEDTAAYAFKPLEVTTDR